VVVLRRADQIKEQETIFFLAMATRVGHKREGGDCGGGITKLARSNKGFDAAASESTQ
jgi:hypothetical protein